jgi:ribonuclease III, bacterial
LNTFCEALAVRLGYRFLRPELLNDALTHRSAGSKHNERLEFLGDSVLNFVIASELYQRCPTAAEGELSRLRASLVNEETLAERACSLSLGDHLILGAGELKSGGKARDSILADALEAVFGAVYLDGGFEACCSTILALYRERLDSLPEGAQLKDPKTRLQEYLQSRKLPLPSYCVAEVVGEAHSQRFEVECRVPELNTVARGYGTSRRRAEQAAACKALKLLEGSEELF